MSKILYNEEGALPCKCCKRKGKIVYPKIVEITGEELFYAQCPECKNKKWDIYEFLGPSKKGAIKTWNYTMGNSKANL